MSERHKRQLHIIDADKLKMPIHIIGCGGIGSWTTLLLAKMGCSNITIYDDDLVEDHNIASQFFQEGDVGKPKSSTTLTNVLLFSGMPVKVLEQEEESEIEEGIVILAIDSMEERIRLGTIMKDKNIFVIDGRMGGLQAEVYCRRAKSYLSTTVAPDRVDEERCTEKSISFNCAFISSMIANYVKMYAKEELDLDSVKNQFIFLFENMTMLKQ